MSKFKLKIQNGRSSVLFNSLDMSELKEPITIHREECLITEESAVFGKAKSEVIDYEDEKYVNLKEIEQNPYIVTDSGQRIFKGKLQEVSDNSMYFAFIPLNNEIQVIPIDKWYGFVKTIPSSKSESFLKKIEQLEAQLTDNRESEESESEDEIDYAAEFDDDDGEEVVVKEKKQKSLSKSGSSLQNLIEEKEISEGKPAKELEAHNLMEEAVKKTQHTLMESDLVRVLKGKKLSIKDLLKCIKQDFKLDEYEKNLIREFIHGKCTFETDNKSNEKLFRLKK